ncbi:hypothetical protein OG905_07150 [Streptomyces sp. NBC_00322]|uniref:hypothetical protein n=1 Tax=Streptomyces sp. NBC_00322 TaxID=2975712 RepID=UPI002E28A774|nr:hypothetical protein [Streptomyces sp. NBC_00322]
MEGLDFCIPGAAPTVTFACRPGFSRSPRDPLLRSVSALRPVAELETDPAGA